MMQPSSSLFGYVEFETPDPGLSFDIPDIVLLESLEWDIDGDSLPGDVEFVLGTDFLLSDTDGDNIDDGTEVEQGTNPLDGLAVATGVIASADTLGTARHVCVQDDLAAVADQGAGVALFNVFNGMTPTLVAQVDTPGSANIVACGEYTGTFAV
jgi:hypothetical protein